MLPGESAPILPLLVAQTVRVADLDVARTLVEAAGFTTRDLAADPTAATPAFFVPASRAGGAAFAFTGPRS